MIIEYNQDKNNAPGRSNWSIKNSDGKNVNGIQSMVLKVLKEHDIDIEDYQIYG